MKFEYVHPLLPREGHAQWEWRVWNRRERQWWRFAFGLRHHQSMAYAAFWRAWNGGRK